MATLEALAISGIRSYNPQKLERIDFTRPLTLICGKNGSGKTTIIQCLKFITTGVLPPSTRQQRSFVMDPSIAKTAQVKGDIRLRFRTAKNRAVIAKKVYMVSKTTKGTVAKAVQQSLKTKDEQGKQIQVSQRCADIQKQIPQMLGISKPILDNIVFCHQDQSLWPFSDNSTLKGIFDELFDTRRFTKALDNMREGIKDYEKQRLQLKGQIQYLKIAYYKTAQNRTQALNSLLQLAQSTKNMYQKSIQFEEVKQKLKQFTKNQNAKNELISKKGVLEYKIIYKDEEIERLKEKANKENVKLTIIQLLSKRNQTQSQSELQKQKQKRQYVEQSEAKIKQYEAKLEKKYKQISMLQRVLLQIKDKEAQNKRVNQFQNQIKRLKQFLPQLNDYHAGDRDAIMDKIGQIFRRMKGQWKRYEQVKIKIQKIVLPAIPYDMDSPGLKQIQVKLQKKKGQLQILEIKIRTLYGILYDPSVLQSYTISNQSKRAGQKLTKLYAQLELKKLELKKYKEMRPRTKSIEQQIFQLNYTGIELQNEMKEYIRRKRQCGMCMKKLNDQDMEIIKLKMNKTIKKTEARIQQLRNSYESNPSEQIDPAPIIKQIENYIQQNMKAVKVLEQQKQQYDKYSRNQQQAQINKQLNRLMQSIQFKSSMTKNQRNVLEQNQKNILKFRQFVQEYRYMSTQCKGISLEILRAKQKQQKMSEIKKQYNKKLEEKRLLEKDEAKLASLVRNYNIIQNIYKKLEQLYNILKNNEGKNSASEQSSTQLENQLNLAQRQVDQLKKQKLVLQLSIEYVKLDYEKQLYRQDLSQTLIELQKISAVNNQNIQLENKRSNLQLELAKHKQKVMLKTSFASKHLPQDTVYLQKLVRYNLLCGLIADITTTMKAMQRATNRLHNQKMDQINKILFDIWQQVYNAKDIEFIRINSVTQKKQNGYGYSIMMQKNGQLIEMKGRCSMGQKVLASLVIRMALAQAFSASTHILTLDEPTTNLDRVHIQNLADSISNILQMQQNSRLQLVIISHDMEFIGLLKKHTSFYYQISRNDKNFSVIQKKQISQLNQETIMPRIETIHY